MAFVSPVPNAFETCSDAAKSTSVQSTVHSGTLPCFLYNQINGGQIGAGSELVQVQIRL